MNEAEPPAWLAVLVIVLLIVLAIIIVFVVVWQLIARRRGDGFAGMREDYRGGVPEPVWAVMQDYNSWSRRHPIVPAFMTATLVGLWGKILFNVTVGVLAGAGAGVARWVLGRRTSRPEPPAR